MIEGPDQLRADIVTMVSKHLASDVDMTLADAALVRELVFALCCSAKTHEVAVRAMAQVCVAIDEETAELW